MKNGSPLQAAVTIVGSQVKLAKCLGVTQQTISHWLKLEKLVPGEYAVAIEHATNGEVPREQVRPDLYEGASSTLVRGGKHGQAVA